MAKNFSLHGIRNIIFDLGGVILDIDIPKAKDAFRELGVTEIDKLFGLGHASSIFKQQEVGKISDDDFIAELNKMSSSELDKEKVFKAWNSLLIAFPEERIKLLKKLKKEYRLFLFSNTNSIHVRAFEKMFRDQFNESFSDLFEKIYYSHVIGLRKPDAESFRFILKDSNLKPEETLFVDDAINNIEGAEAVGLKTLHISKDADLVVVWRSVSSLLPSS